MSISANRVFHVNVNCSDLDRSIGYYGKHAGLSPAARTRPVAPQPGGAVGLEAAQWDAFMMTGWQGGAGPVVDLLEWKLPPPTGRPHATPVALGFTRLLVTSPDVETSTVLTDPDGTLVQLEPGERPGLAGVVVGSSDLARSRAFYSDIVGLEAGPQPLAVAGPARGTAARLRDRAGAFALELVEWRSADRVPGPYPVANHLGIYRMALMTGDIEADYHTLQANGVVCVSPPATLDMGPGLPRLRALLFLDPDGTALELIETPAGTDG
ncbi:MAG: hypothetical protein JOZ99_12345 [Actinobacteria bacterium]|nr:hypothetical protein [Actinomycetota bacterium]